MDESKLAEIEAWAKEWVPRCDVCDAPARWNRGGALRSDVCAGCSGGEAAGVPLEGPELDALDLVAEVRRLTAAVQRLESLRPHPLHRTGHRCACCGREGAPEADTLCPWCREAQEAEAQRDALRAIIEGRTTPPTREAFVALGAAGGTVRYHRPDGGHGWFPAASPWFPTTASLCREGARLWAHDAAGRPCAWPVAPANGGAS
jgi:hypothetical protein